MQTDRSMLKYSTPYNGTLAYLLDTVNWINFPLLYSSLEGSEADMPHYDNQEYVRIMRTLPKNIETDIFSIPFIAPDDINISNLNNGKWLIGIKNATANGNNAKNKIVHMFSHDSVLRPIYDNPYRLLSRVSRYYAVATPDFSMYKGMCFPDILQAVYKNRWIGAFLQSNGKKVVATVGWIEKEYDYLTFAGLKDGSVFIISSLSTRNTLSEYEFLRGYHEMRNRFPSSKIICVGLPWKGIDQDVCLISYKDSFGSRDKRCTYWQQKMYNLDMSVAEEVVGYGI